MKLTNIQIDSYLNTLSSLKEEHELGWAIAKNIHILSDAAREYLEMKQRLVEQYGEGDAGRKVINGNTNPEGLRAYKEAMGDVPNMAQDVNVYQIDRKTFCSGRLNSTQMAALMWMVEEEE